MKAPSVVELTVKQQQQRNGCHQNCMKFKIRKNSLLWGEIGLDFKLRKKLKVDFIREITWIGAVPGKLWVIQES